MTEAIRNSGDGLYFKDAAPAHSHSYLLPAIRSILEREDLRQRRILDVGCGNGSVANHLIGLGWQVVGVDPSESAMQHARIAYPSIEFYQASGYDDLSSRFGKFPVVVSLEVIEHVYDPRKFASTLWNCVESGGIAIVSTPYHGYLKNVALAVSGRLDQHFTALWDHGHIKFWSIRTLDTLLRKAGFSSVTFQRVGRIPCLAKSMIAVARVNPRASA